jgi:hypothetical protein
MLLSSENVLFSSGDYRVVSVIDWRASLGKANDPNILQFCHKTSNSGIDTGLTHSRRFDAEPLTRVISPVAAPPLISSATETGCDSPPIHNSVAPSDYQTGVESNGCSASLVYIAFSSLPVKTPVQHSAWLKTLHSIRLVAA